MMHTKGGKRMKTCLAAALLLALAAPAAAQEMPGSTMLKASDPAMVARYLNQLGYRAKLGKDSEGDPKVETGLGGYKVGLYFYGCTKGAGCTSMQLQTAIGADYKLTLPQVNEFNRKYRFVNLSLDSDSDPSLSYDLPSAASGISGDAFQQAVEIFEEQIARVSRMLDEAKAAAAK